MYFYNIPHGFASIAKLHLSNIQGQVPGFL
jgi:hypothetical protein